ncbi:MAG: uracil-DNA glycosylase [Spirochaetes bacterium]|nr:MAG: uracil-DNA glycosylase [Spirochaetota bacterium]
MTNDEKAAKNRVLLQELRDHIGDCTRCKLSTTRTNIVFGEGNPAARVMFIGEGPGREEDLQSRPFVGRAGVLLTAIIEKGMQVPREDVYIANVVKCRPTVNMEFQRDRPPDDEERATCGPFLKKQIEIIRPEVIVTLGNPSTQFLLNTKQGITKLRGTWCLFGEIPVMPTYHPAYVLRNGDMKSPLKKDVWEDIKKVLQRLELPAGAPLDAKITAAAERFESLKDDVTPARGDGKNGQGSLF